MSDLSPAIDHAAARRLLVHVDVEGKLVRALESLGPVADRDVLVVDAMPGVTAAALSEAGARVLVTGLPEAEAAAVGARAAGVANVGVSPGALPLADESVDVVVGMHSAYRGVDPVEQAEVDRVLRAGGRLLVVHDYGRDDVAELLPTDLPEYGDWGRRGGPFLAAGFRVRVIHCWWSFETLDEARGELEGAFGPRGAAVAATLRRPRLSHNLAVYHRDRRVPVGSPASADRDGRTAAGARGPGW